MEKPFKITFPHQVAAVIRVHSLDEISAALRSLGLPQQHRRVLVVIGGASKLTQDDYQRVQQLFLEVLAPLAQRWQACVVDGGTDAGVMRLMGAARAAIAGTFPLIGVSPIGLATFPEHAPTSEDAAPLEPYHSHFLLVPGSKWGDESPWIANVASELAGNAPSVTVLINGGEVTWKDARQNIQAGRSVIVIAGSGRTADVLAAVLRGEQTDARAESLIRSGLVTAVDLENGANGLMNILETIFSEQLD
jgi:SLOG in TRPM, prokaryote